MSRQYRMPRRYNRIRKYGGKCEGCGQPTPEREIRQTADESNISITWHAPYLCPVCWNKAHIRVENA